MAENDNTGYDPEALNAQAEQDHELPDTATITDVEETVAGSVYPEDVDLDDPTKPMIRVEAETPDGTPITETFSLPQSETAWRNPNFKLGNFRDQYGKVPEPGMEVSVAMNDEGLLEIVY